MANPAASNDERALKSFGLAAIGKHLAPPARCRLSRIQRLGRTLGLVVLVGKVVDADFEVVDDQK